MLAFACGPSAPAEQPEAPAQAKMTAPQTGLTSTANCTASATNGVPPYRYFWRTDYYYCSTGSTVVGSYYEGSSTYGPQTCPFGRYANPQE